MKEVIFTDKAPAAIGTYSQAIKVNNTVYLSGQIPKDPLTGAMITGDFKKEVKQIFANLSAVANAAGGNLSQIVKLTVFLTDFNLFADLNAVMLELFSEPYPARSTVQVSRLPADSRVEIEAVMTVGE
ncbi:MAG TPA: RidA family protein [Gammaproteobacteria bacterium]|nr:RidA family protein [Gammaproteobacteria bacterium]